MKSERTVRDVDIQAVVERTVAQADEALLEQLYDRYALSLFRFALALTGSVDDAEDAVQEVFVRAARNGGLGRVKHVGGYLFAAVRNAAWSVLRNRRKTEALREASQRAFDLEPHGKLAEQAEWVLVLRKAMADLPADQREVLVLKVFDGLTFEEVARTLGIRPGTAASRYRYAILKLRQALEGSN